MTTTVYKMIVPKYSNLDKEIIPAYSILNKSSAPKVSTSRVKMETSRFLYPLMVSASLPASSQVMVTSTLTYANALKSPRLYVLPIATPCLYQYHSTRYSLVKHVSQYLSFMENSASQSCYCTAFTSDSVSLAMHFSQ